MYLTLSSRMSAFSNLRFRICGRWEGLSAGSPRWGERGMDRTTHRRARAHLVRIVLLQQRPQLLQRHVDARPPLLLHQWLGDLWTRGC